MAYTIPDVAAFKAYFVRDFIYAENVSSVMNADIQKGLDDAGVNINPSLFASQQIFNIAYLNLAAHFMVLSLSSASQGVQGRYTWLVSSKSVGNVSESYTIPQRFIDNPYLASLSKTNYGAKYLSMVLPLITGNMFTVEGGTTP